MHCTNSSHALHFFTPGSLTLFRSKQTKQKTFKTVKSLIVEQNISLSIAKMYIFYFQKRLLKQSVPKTVLGSSSLKIMFGIPAYQMYFCHRHIFISSFIHKRFFYAELSHFELLSICCSYLEPSNIGIAGSEVNTANPQ